MFSFTRHRRKAYIITALLVTAGLLSLAVSGLNLGIDFTGGTVIYLRPGTEWELAEVESVLAARGLQGQAVVQVTQGKDAQGRTTDDGVILKIAGLPEKQRDALVEAFRERWPGMDADRLRVESVGAVIGGELTRQALLALLVAMAAMVLYITFRFELKFALSTIAALLTDVLVVVGIFSILQIEVNVPFVAAVLTVFGYSVNDSIVIIDRIRETIKHKQRDDFPGAVDEAIRHSLTRSLNTSLTTLLVLAALLIGFYYFIGSHDLVAFAVALMIGIVCGTYSSIFIAGPLWLDLKELEYRRLRKRPAS